MSGFGVSPRERVGSGRVRAGHETREGYFNCAWAYPKTQNRKKSEGSGQLTTRI